MVTKGTLTEGEMLSTNPDPSYLMAVTESFQSSTNQHEERVFGVCAVDVATSRIILGQVGIVPFMLMLNLCLLYSDLFNSLIPLN